MMQRIRGAWPYFALLLFTVAFHFPLLLPGRGISSFNDLACMHAPYRMLASQAVWQGRIPHWTDKLFGGYPILADPQMAFFYPVNLLFAAVQNPGSQAIMNLFLLGNLLLLALAGVWLARSLGMSRSGAFIAGLLLSHHGFILVHLSHINILQTLACSYAALGFLLRMARSRDVVRRYQYATAAGLLLASGNLAGHPQTVMYMHYTIGFTMVIVAARQWDRRTRSAREIFATLALFAGAVVLGVLGSIVQLLPTAELLRSSVRMTMTREIAMDVSLSWQTLPVVLFPGLYQSLQLWVLATTNPYTALHQWLALDPLETGAHLGLVAFGLGITGWLAKRRTDRTADLLLAAIVFLLLAAMGPHTGAYTILYDYFPGVDVVRVATRVLMVAYMGCAVLAGWGMEAVLAAAKGDTISRSACRRGVGVVVFAALALLAVLVIARLRFGSWLQAGIELFVAEPMLFEHTVRQKAGQFLTHLQVQTWLAVVLALLMGALLIFGPALRRPRLVAVLMFLLLTVEMLLLGTGRGSTLYPDPWPRVQADVYKALPAGAPAGRVHTPAYLTGGTALNVSMVEGPPNATGYSIIRPLWTAALEASETPPFAPVVDARKLDLLNVSDVVLPRRFVLGGDSTGKAIYEDWGWATIAPPLEDTETTGISGRQFLPAQYTFDLESTAPVRALHVIAASTSSTRFSDGTTVGLVRVLPQDPAAPEIEEPLVLGRNISDLWIEHPVHRSPAAHSPAPYAYASENPWWPNFKARFNYAAIRPPQPVQVRAVQVIALGTPEVALAVSQLLVETSDGQLRLLATESEGMRHADSADDRYLRLVRPHPGWAWMVPEARPASYKKTDNVIFRMFQPDFDLNQYVLVDKQRFAKENWERYDVPAVGFDSRAQVVEHSDPDRLVVKVTDPTPMASDQPGGWLVVSQAWFPGWSATVDSKPAELLQGNGSLKTLPLPAGDHVVELSYLTPGFVAGAGISTLVWLGSFIMLLAAPQLHRRWKSRTARP